jgi:acetylornithine/succinyldiaminopimelate/putrescine aminotransferase
MSVLFNRQFRWQRADNATVWSYGRAFTDFTSGIFCANVGHNNPVVNDAVAAAIAKYGPHTYTYDTGLRNTYERELLAWTGYDAMQLFTTGSEAVEAALRIARWDVGPDATVYKLADTFHGKTYGPMETLTTYNVLPGKMRTGIIEGYRGWDARFWSQETVDLIKSAEIVIFDEIQSGFGRTGTRFAYQHYDGLAPDLLVIGKGMCNGYPGSAVLARGEMAEIMSVNQEEWSNTHGGNPITCAAGLAVLGVIDRGKIPDQESCALLQYRLREIWDDVSGRGMVAALLTKSVEDADQIVLAARDKGLLLVHTGKASVKIGPPLTISYEQLATGLVILEEVLCVMLG